MSNSEQITVGSRVRVTRSITRSDGTTPAPGSINVVVGEETFTGTVSKASRMRGRTLITVQGDEGQYQQTSFPRDTVELLELAEGPAFIELSISDDDAFKADTYGNSGHVAEWAPYFDTEALEHGYRYEVKRHDRRTFGYTVGATRSKDGWDVTVEVDPSIYCCTSMGEIIEERLQSITREAKALAGALREALEEGQHAAK